MAKFNKNFKSKPRKKKGKNEPMGIRGVQPALSAIIPSEDDDVIVSSTINETTYVRQFQLNDILNYSNYAAYDQYRINWVQIKLVPIAVTKVTSDADVTGAVALTPNIVVYIDRDDVGTGSVTYDALRVRHGAQVLKATKGWSRKFRPNLLYNVYNGLNPDAHVIPLTPNWVDTGNVSCSHYGFKAVMEPGGQVDGNFVYKVEVRYCMSFANRRT